MSFSAIVRREGKAYISWCPELDVESQGRTIEKALENLEVAVEQFLEVHPGMRGHHDAQLTAAAQ